MDAITLLVKHNGRPLQHLFFVADITSDNLILGYPFFEDANPSVLWKEGKLEGTLMLAMVHVTLFSYCTIRYTDWTELLLTDTYHISLTQRYDEA
jgi:hypothetical protein